MPDVFGAILRCLSRQSATTDSTFFRLNYRITVIILLASACLMIVQEIFQGPMKCTFKDYPEDNFDRYCSTKSFFSLRRKVTTLENVSSVKCSPRPAGVSLSIADKHQLGFITLLLQAILFYIPRFLWNWIEGRKMEMLATELITSTRCIGCSERNENPLDSYFRKHFRAGDKYANRYTLCEFSSLFNICIQMALLDMFIGYRFAIETMFTKQPTDDTDMPGQLVSITTQCSFAGPSDGPGNPGNIKGSCRLSQNSINEPIHYFLCFWMYVLAVYGLLVALYRIATCMSSSLRWFEFRASCGEIPDETIASAYKRLEHGDWFVLLMLRKTLMCYITRS
ncbi:viral innexin 2 [Diadegma semiclausum ichnovirus]|nr:viral innexin 2 [Diadegma semiclausum ichnovirus]